MLVMVYCRCGRKRTGGVYEKEKSFANGHIPGSIAFDVIHACYHGADVILVGAGDFTLPGFSDRIGITGTEQYNNGGFRISWVITNEGGSFPFHYTYTVSNGTGSSCKRVKSFPP